MSLFRQKQLSTGQVEEFAAKGDFSGLAKALVDQDAAIRQRAAHLLGVAALDYVGSGSRADYQLQDSLTEPLVAMLNEEDQNSRQHAAEAARAFCDDRAVDPLIALLEDSSISPMLAVRLGAADALGAIGDVRAAEPLARQILNPKNGGSSLPQAAREALQKLGDAGVDAGVDVLVGSLRTPDGEVSDSAVTGIQHLAKIGGPRGKEGLTRFIEGLRGDTEREAKAREEARLRLEYWPAS